MLPDYLELIQYKNDQVVTHFCHNHPEVSLEAGYQLFEDLLSWLWLNKQRALQGKKTPLFGPLLQLDKMWHIFILHTKDYFEFSKAYFGDYFHHHVEPLGFEHHLKEEELSDYLNDCFDYLDGGWVERCFSAALNETERTD